MEDQRPGVMPELRVQPPAPAQQGWQPPPSQQPYVQPPGLQHAPLVCPRCSAAAAPAPAPQQCRGCSGLFSLFVGAAMDPSCRPPPPGGPSVRVKAAGLATYRTGLVEAQGVAEGQTDPILGMIPMDTAGVAWGDILTISVWRKIDVLPLVIALLVPAPLAVLGLVVTLENVAGLGLMLPFALLAAWAIYRAVSIKKNFVRVVGRYRTINIRFDRPLWRRRTFHDELLRRAGLPPAPIP